MKKVFLNVFVTVLILSFIFQPSSALASSSAKTIEPELEVLANSHVLSEPQILETLEHRNGSVDLLDDLLMELELPEEVRADIPEQTEPVEKPEYVSPTPEVVAQTQAQVEAFDCGSVTDVPKIECEALVALYASTNGAGWGSHIGDWLIGTTVDSWERVTVTNGHVSEIQLYLAGLSGILPPQLGDLVYLEHFSVHNNDLSGIIPDDITKLTNLKKLALSDNNYSGPLPVFLGTLTRLVSLSLGDNCFTGSIPPEYGELDDLEWLSFSENCLTGSIPSELGKLSKLVTLHLDRSGVSGIIPNQLGELSQLQELNLFRTPVTGNIPLTFKNLTQLKKFHFYDTALCEPPTLDFLTWKATVSDWRSTGLICEAFEGGITSPPSLIETGPTDLPIIATAESLSGQGVAQVEFYAKWNGFWHKLGVDTTTPYSLTWNIPDTLNTQFISLRIDVVGIDGDRGEFVGGSVPVIYFQSLNNPAVVENYVLRSKRAYLNQRSLDNVTPKMEGDVMCGAASMAMILAMEGVIPTDYASMAKEAKEIYDNLGKAVGIYDIKPTLGNREYGLAAKEFIKITPDEAWNYVKEYIDLGHPLIMHSDHYSLTVGGHYVVIVGYKETDGVRYVISYDPYGEWLGRTCIEIDGKKGPCRDNYKLNTNEPNSTRGKWVTYNFEKLFTSVDRWKGVGNLYVAPNPNNVNALANIGSLSEPDEISDEPIVIGTYEGVLDDDTNSSIFIPLINR